MSEMNLSELLINLNELIDFQGLMNSQLVTAFTFDLKSVKDTLIIEGIIFQYLKTLLSNIIGIISQ